MNEQIKHLCTSGAFDAFKEIADSIPQTRIEYGEAANYMIGKRDGAEEFKTELFELIEKLAKE